MSEPILHHYPQSPVSEKVRVVLGIKGLAWRSVEIPRLPPKPDLMPLTGGYRRTPVLQVGADVYCDSQCIVRELQRRFPEPTLFPGGAEGMAWGVSRWTDAILFPLVVAIVFGGEADDLPPSFLADRGPLYFGAGFDLQVLRAQLPHNLAQMRAQLGWMDQRLVRRPFVLGDAPGLPDALAWHVVWFLRGRYRGGPGMLEEFTHLEGWEQRMGAIGHGTPTPMPAAEALEAARVARTTTPARSDPRDPQGLTPGAAVTVVPDDPGGGHPVSGRVHAVSADTLTVLRADERVGEVAVHFPRVGYRVSLV